jgi:uncharacterized membrane-anchored protein
MANRHILAKVPEITIIFWVIKVLTTGMGETASDYMVTHMDPVIGVILGGIGLLVALSLQFVAKRYVAWIYWFAVVMVSVFGTMAADVVHIVLGVPYLVSTIFFIVALAVVFVAWYAREKTLSIHSIYTAHREAFYWATVLTTFALGTAAGDYTAATLGFGYFGSGLLFAVLIAVPTIGYFFFGLNEIVAFWFAYIVTRPLGASFADWMGVSHARGGLAWGTGPVTIALTIIIFGLVAYLALTRKDVERKR